MNQTEIDTIGLIKLNDNEKQALLNWGMRMYSLGQHPTGSIQEIKYGGRLVILDDDSRWEVDEFEAEKVELWNLYDSVVIIDNEMFLLDDNEKVTVEEDLV